MPSVGPMGPAAAPAPHAGAMVREPLRRRSLLAAGAAAVMPAAAAGRVRAANRGTVEMQLLNITDLHGYLQAAPGTDAVVTGAGGARYTVGGAAYLAAHLKRLRRGHRNSVLFATGDLFSGWEFDATAFADEPTIEVLNRLGLRFSTAGNHEFDRSPAFLTRHMEHGEAYPEAGRDDAFPDSTGRPFHGADFRYYSANVVWSATGRTVLPPYNIEWADAGDGRRIPVGFIHLTVPGTASFPCSYQPALGTLDPLATADRCAAELASRGVRALVLSVHDGAHAGPDPTTGTHPSGPAYELARRVSPAIDAVVTGHWHHRFTMSVPDPDGVPRPFVEAGCHGQVVNETVLRLDPGTGRVVRELTTSVNHPNTRDIAPDPGMERITAYWAGQAAARARTPVGRQTGSFTRQRTPAGESTLGNLAADWARWAGSRPLGPFDDGNIHPARPADLGIVATAPRTGPCILGGDLVHDGASGTVVFAAAWNAVGYGDPVLTVTVGGRQIHRALEDQWYHADGQLQFAPLAVSRNVQYTYDATGPAGDRIAPHDVLLDGRPLDPSRSYRLAAPAYTLLGLDGTTAFAGFRTPVRHERDHESFIAYVRAHTPLTPAPLGRVRARG